MSSRKEFPHTFEEADYALGSRKSRIIANNTRLVRRHVWSIALQLHSTDIVTWDRDGSIELETGGWNTVTTRERINRAIRRYDDAPSWCVGTDRGTLFLYAGSWDERRRYAWARGKMILYPDGTTAATLAPKRTHRPHVNPNCACAACAAKRHAGEYRNRWHGLSPSSPVYVEPLTTPEDTASEATIPDGVSEMRWSDYNRKMNALLAGRSA
jgi:hypothetical protein